MNYNKHIVNDFIKQTLITFAAATMAIGAVGWLLGNEAKGAGGLFHLGHEGLSYHSLLQIFVYAFIVAVLKVLAFSDSLIKNMLMLWRIVLLLFLSFISAIVCAVTFHWFPIGDQSSWLQFLLSAGLCFAITIMLLIIKIRVQDRKYSRMLTAYQEKRDGNKL